MFASADERSIAFRDAWIDCEISNTLEKLGYEVDSESREKLQHAFRQVLPRAYEILAQRVEGDYSPEPHGSRLPKLEHGRLAEEKAAVKMISAAFDGYCREAQRRGLSQPLAVI